ncbi:hypothetical protein [Thermomonospora umbrina]|uniref:Uncharacterized protein n=1 Tax=Thermomonospora umbrina TaxID=111806 RepID=A0A3D9SZV6_9ACTN|nr:hypothetical protein [Thermomonospora umbrina]REE99593.1 hypothetical protein DFJ69_5106 [Thermomonospora umbrina]
MADDWVDIADGSLESWAIGHEGGIDAQGVRLLLDLAGADPGVTGPDDLTPDRMRHLMLRTFPEAVVAEVEDVPSVLATATAMVDFLVSSGRLTDDRGAALRETLAGLEPELTEIVGELDLAERESAGEIVRGMMAADGVDLDDEDAVQGWLGRFESLSDDERFDRAAAYLRENEESAVPPVELAPVAELAGAARRSGLTRRALALAAWAGERVVTDAGMPTPEDAEDAASALDLPRDDVESLWRAVAGADVLTVGHGRVEPGPALKDLREGDDASVLAAWVRLFDEAVAGDEAESGTDVAALVRGELTGVLIHLYEQEGPGTREELTAALAGHLLDTRMDHGATPPPDEVAAALGRELDGLAAWGVIAEDAGGPELTPLGVWGVRELLIAEGFTAPVVGGLTAGSAAALVDGLQGYDEETAALEMDRWVAAREPRAAAAELIRVMRSDGPGARNVADAVLHGVDAEAAPVVREALEEPATRPYAMLWLLERGLTDEELGTDEMSWVLTDTVAALMEIAGPGEAVAEALTDVPADAGLAALIERMAEIGHPSAAEVLDALGAHLPDAAPADAARAGAARVRSR